MKLFLLCALLTYSAFINAQSLFVTSGSNSLSSGHLSVCRKDVWAVFNNPANIEHKRILVACSNENNPLTPECKKTILALSLPIGRFQTAIGLAQTGIQGYTQQMMVTAWALALNKNFNLGVQCGAYLLQANDYANKIMPLTGIGCRYQLTFNTCLGLYLLNPIMAGMKNRDMPVILRAGAQRSFNNHITGGVEISQVTEQKMCIGAGTQYQITPSFQVSVGLSTGPSWFTFGSQFQYKQIGIGCGAAMQEYTGQLIRIDLHYFIR